MQDELESGKLQRYCVLDGVVERFSAITAKRHFEPVALKTLLEQAQQSIQPTGSYRTNGNA